MWCSSTCASACGRVRWGRTSRPRAPQSNPLRTARRRGRVYFTLTNNSRRTVENQDPSNPRPRNVFGHIIRWREAGDDHSATAFVWDIFPFAGDEATGRIGGKPLTADNVLGCPDGLWFDAAGRLWVHTDIGENEQNRGPRAVFGNNQML